MLNKIFDCPDLKSSLTRAEIMLGGLYGTIEEFKLQSADQPAITRQFDQIFDQLKESHPNLYKMYYEKYRDTYIDQVVDFSNVENTETLIDDDGNSFQETKTIREWVLNIIQNVVKSLRGSDPAEGKKEDEKRLCFRPEILEKIKAEIAEECFEPTVSPHGEFFVFQSKLKNGNVWIYDKNGELLKSFKTDDHCYPPGISTDGKWMLFLRESDGCQYYMYENFSPNGASFTVDPSDEVKIYTAIENGPRYLRNNDYVREVRYACFRNSLTGTLFITQIGDNFLDKAEQIVETDEDKTEVDQKIEWIISNLNQIMEHLPNCYSVTQIAPDGEWFILQGKEENNFWIFNKDCSMIATFKTPARGLFPKILSSGEFFVIQNRDLDQESEFWLYHKYGVKDASFKLPGEIWAILKMDEEGQYILLVDTVNPQDLRVFSLKDKRLYSIEETNVFIKANLIKIEY